ncbi:hypothetical protein COB64_01620 [Candidatus Wolfebacteria bacterium]|nr:MAG: hypothetical protein COB64_01620 [Candidatus Wolfebacteria bacterium]
MVIYKKVSSTKTEYMKKFLSLLLFIGIFLSTSRDDHAISMSTSIDDPKNPFKNMDELIEAIACKESRHNDNAMGDLTEFDSILNGIDTAYGYLQITNDVIIDVNQTLGTNYRSIDAKGNRELSIKLFYVYIERYATFVRLKRIATQEDIARIWNGGPNGFKKETTIVYWEDVKSCPNK